MEALGTNSILSVEAEDNVAWADVANVIDVLKRFEGDVVLLPTRR
jgi:hypothetical protein